MNLKEHRRKVLTKLGFVKSEGGKHEIRKLTSSSTGQLVLKTTVSRGNDHIGHGLLKKFCDQLHVTKSQYQEIALCNMSKTDYYSHLLDEDIIATP